MFHMVNVPHHKMFYRSNMFHMVNVPHHKMFYRSNMYHRVNVPHHKMFYRSNMFHVKYSTCNMINVPQGKMIHMAIVLHEKYTTCWQEHMNRWNEQWHQMDGVCSAHTRGVALATSFSTLGANPNGFPSIQRLFG